MGQNLGAGKPDRAETAVWRTGLYNMIFLGTVGVFFVLFAEPVVRLFTSDPAVVPLGASCLRIVSYGNIGYAYGMVMLQAFNGAGDTITPTIVNFFGFWLLEIPLAYWLAIPLQMQSNGAFWAIVMAEAAIAGRARSVQAGKVEKAENLRRPRLQEKLGREERYRTVISGMEPRRIAVVMLLPRTDA